MSIYVPFNDFCQNPEVLIKAELAAAESVIRSGWWILGNQVRNFEAAWAAVCESFGCVGVANGLDAIEIGLRALGIGPGDEVITTSMTAYATTLAIQRCGATPVFADIDPQTACLCPSSVSLCIGPKTKAVLVVHLYGRVADLGQLKSICDSSGLHLIEDCAQAHLARWYDHAVGSVGVFAAWSFYPTKNLGTIGDAGALTSSDENLLALARKLRNYGQSDRYYHDVRGLNSRLDELHAAFLLQRLIYLPSWTARRREIATRYWSEINHHALDALQVPHNKLSHVHHLFVLRSTCRDAVQYQLEEHGVQTLIHYPVPCHHQKALGIHRNAPNGLPITEMHAQTCFSIPIHPFLTDDQIDHVINTCNNLHV